MLPLSSVQECTGLPVAGELARWSAALIRGDHEKALDQWIDDAAGTELDALAKSIRRHIDAVRAAITHPWCTSPVGGRINRLKTLKRQMYGRVGYELLGSRLLAAA
ncbi:transposase [Agrobacterium sp. T29]|uniref:transposase n=1 Tax=Agrobacterium sp. T29 TaxID=2580515 RepID=UPI00115E4991|nr:transposase [Agrobacterium sp. T29]